MIRVGDEVLRPTIFPDGTSQVWKLSDAARKATRVEWRFEEERELIWLFQLDEMLPSGYELHIPYLPYARQDKEWGNDATWALESFARILNEMHMGHVRAFDVHNPERTKDLIYDFRNDSARDVHFRVLRKLAPDFVIFPDQGAADRYPWLSDNPMLVFNKVRDQATGAIIGLTTRGQRPSGRRGLIVDDICDGGATFINVAREMKKQDPDCELHLFVSHGLFSKGRKVLHDAGIVTVNTTDSLMRNKEDGWKI